MLQSRPTPGSEERLFGPEEGYYVVSARLRVSEPGGSQPGSLPRQIRRTLLPSPELGHGGSPGVPSPRGRLRAKLSQAQPVSVDTTTSRLVARASALPPAR